MINILINRNLKSTFFATTDVAKWIVNNLEIKKLANIKIIHLSNNKKLSLYDFIKNISDSLNISKKLIVAVEPNFLNKNVTKEYSKEFSLEDKLFF